MSILTIRVGTEPVRSELALLTRRLGDQTPAMAAIGNLLQGSIIENFETGTSPEGVKWKPSKRVLKHGGQTLVDSGLLKNSVGMEASATQVVVYEAKEYAPIHQDGGVIKREARQQTVRLKTYTRGPRRGRTLFARKGKEDRSMLANVGAHQIKIPARPSVGVKARDWSNIKFMLLRWVLNGQP